MTGRTTLVALLIGHVVAPLAAAQPGLQGDWLGQVNVGTSWQRVNLHFTLDQGKVGATLDLPQQGRYKLPLDNLVQDASRLRFAWRDKSTVTTYDGQIQDGVFSGAYEQGASRGTFRFVRVANALADPRLNSQVAGSYQLAPDRFIDLAPFYEDEDRPIFFDSKTRRTGVLYALSQTEFFTGPSYGVLFPIDVRVTFTRNERGEVTGLTWRESDNPAITAPRVGPYVQEEISFRNGDVTLRGTLTLPATKGPHPVVIQVHGSGPARRPGGHWMHFFARQGIAYLYFDKRGSGASTGDWSQSTIDDLAGDVLAAVEALRTRQDVHPRGICLWGNSNGGWVAPLAASRSKHVALLIVRSGSGLPIHENILYELEMDMRRAGNFTAQDILRAREIRKQLNAALLTNGGWEAMKATVEKAKKEKWFPYARVQWLPLIPPPLDSEKNPYLKGLRGQIDFDPESTWEKVSCPVLVLLGELDANVPSQASAAIIECALRMGGNTDFTITILPKANHGLLETVSGDAAEGAHLKKYVPGYMDGMAEWLLKRVAASK